MELLNLYKCLCDIRRLRILNLLKQGPLCVCHLQEVLEETQVRMSKQLGYMRKLGIVTASREGTWMIYRLSDPAHPLLTENLKCLQDCAAEYPFFKDDLRRWASVMERIRYEGSECPGVVVQGSACC